MQERGPRIGVHDIERQRTGYVAISRRYDRNARVLGKKISTDNGTDQSVATGQSRLRQGRHIDSRHVGKIRQHLDGDADAVSIRVGRRGSDGD